MNAAIKTLLLIIATAVWLCPVSQAGEPPRVQVDFFYEPGCDDCAEIQNTVLPELQMRFQGLYELHMRDFSRREDAAVLVEYQRRFGDWENEPVSAVVDRVYKFCGTRAIQQGLIDCVEQCIAHRLDSAAESVSGNGAIPVQRDMPDQFTVPAVLLAGLLDGINPCAISTLVFFMSLLTVSKVRNRQLILLGISFCIASFLTYLALGFGLLRALHLFAGFKPVRMAVEWLMTVTLLILAFLSFRDALRFRKTGRADGITLQLSTGMKKRIHDVMRRGLRSTSILLGGLFIGAAVTALESVCTGQVYVPTLVLILKDSAFLESRAWLLLLLYNLMFVLPLIAAFAVTYSGTRMEALRSWSRRNVVLSKTLLGIFFLLLLILF